jgi:hypothetical protein
MSEANEICKRGTMEPPTTIKSAKGVLSNPRFLLATNEGGNNFGIGPDLPSTTQSMSSNALSSSAVKEECVFCSDNTHTIKVCPKFKSEHTDKRWEWVAKHRLCFRCLSVSHRRDRCKSKRKCATCNMSGHHTLLHNFKKEDAIQRESVAENATSANVWSGQTKKVYLKVVPVCVEGPTGSINTYALLDEGSTVTLVEKAVADGVGAIGPEVGLNLQGAVSGSKDTASTVVALTVRTSDGMFKLDRVRTVNATTECSHQRPTIR